MLFSVSPNNMSRFFFPETVDGVVTLQFTVKVTASVLKLMVSMETL